MGLQKLLLLIVGFLMVDVCHGQNAFVDGRECIRGYENMRDPPTRPPPCPSFRTESGQCFVGDQEFTRIQCIRMFRPRGYRKLKKGYVLPWVRPL